VTSSGPSQAGHKPSKVLFVGGFGRSGSTLIGRVLGEAPDAVCVGEARYVWSRGLLHNVQCGCGQPFRSCSFWQAVGDEAYGGWDNVDPQYLANLDDDILMLRTLPFHWVPSLKSGFAAAIEEYSCEVKRLYRAIAAVTGAKVIVDTSKDPNFALMLARMPEFDLRIVHLVRDSRAVAYSWTRNKRMPSPIGDQKFLERFAPTFIAPRWLIWNVALRALSLRNPHYTRIKYEDFVAAPRPVLEQLSDYAQEQLVLGSDLLTEGRVKLGAHHMFSGNPMRANVGWLDISLDDEWQSKMPGSQIAEVTAITWPQLWRYGYRMLPGRRRDRIR
jgi:hypothetical protein